MQQLKKKLLICKVHEALKIIVKLQVEFAIIYMIQIDSIRI